MQSSRLEGQRSRLEFQRSRLRVGSLHAFVLTYAPACKLKCLHANTLTCLCVYMMTYVHLYMRTCIHAYMRPQVAPHPTLCSLECHISTHLLNNSNVLVYNNEVGNADNTRTPMLCADILHAYMLMRSHAFMLTYLQAYLFACLHAYMCACLRSYKFACLHA